jgi:hypothetical protein
LKYGRAFGTFSILENPIYPFTDNRVPHPSNIRQWINGDHKAGRAVVVGIVHLEEQASHLRHRQAAAARGETIATKVLSKQDRALEAAMPTREDHHNSRDRLPEQHLTMKRRMKGGKHTPSY